MVKGVRTGVGWLAGQATTLTYDGYLNIDVLDHLTMNNSINTSHKK